MDVPLPSTGQGLGLPGRQDRGGRGPAVLSPHTDLLGAGWLQPGARWPPLCARTQPQGWLQYYLQIKTTEGITECDPEDTPRASPREPRPRGVGVDGRCPPQWSLRPHAGFTGSQVRSPASREAEAAGMGRCATWLAWALVTEPSGGVPGGKDSPLRKGRGQPGKRPGPVTSLHPWAVLLLLTMAPASKNGTEAVSAGPTEPPEGPSCLGLWLGGSARWPMVSRQRPTGSGFHVGSQARAWWGCQRSPDQRHRQHSWATLMRPRASPGNQSVPLHDAAVKRPPCENVPDPPRTQG